MKKTQGRSGFLPTSLSEGEVRYRDFLGFDVVFVTGDPVYDHPLSGVAVLSRLLDAKGYRVGIVAQPETEEEFAACGRPRLLFCVTTGLLDSMLANYTPLLKKREHIRVPERGLIAYTQQLKRSFPGCIVALGGVEATTRRFTHFDYKTNKLRRGILHDSKADLLLFGNAERSLLTLLQRLNENNYENAEKRPFENIKDVLALSSLDGAAYRIRKTGAARIHSRSTESDVTKTVDEKPTTDENDETTANEKNRAAPAHAGRQPGTAGESNENVRKLPSFEECAADKGAFGQLAVLTYSFPEDAFVEECGLGAVRHNKPSAPLTVEEMDLVYSSPFTRKLHPQSKDYRENLAMIGKLDTSVVIGRGCWGGCAFCIIPLVQGKNVARRSPESILAEIERLYENNAREIVDLTLPTLNMYGSSCDQYTTEETVHSPILEKDIAVLKKTAGCDQRCTTCKHRVLTDDLITLLDGVEALEKKLPGLHVELRSALRHDLSLRQPALFRKAMTHVSRLKIAPEHTSGKVLKVMRKASPEVLDAFLREFAAVNKEQGTDKRLVPYFVVAHPGCSMDEMRELREYCKRHNLFVNLTQVFTPTPGTLSTAIYYTGVDPFTRETVYIPSSFREKKDQKNLLLNDWRDDEFRDENG